MRMTDERLAEIRLRVDGSVILTDGGALAVELLQALKAERKAYTALLEQLESLRDKWRKVVYTKTYGNGKPLDKCADELEAIIKEARG